MRNCEKGIPPHARVNCILEANDVGKPYVANKLERTDRAASVEIPIKAINW